MFPLKIKSTIQKVFRNKTKNSRGSRVEAQSNHILVNLKKRLLEKRLPTSLKCKEMDLIIFIILDLVLPTRIIYP